jgi:hypothetical protein
MSKNNSLNNCFDFNRENPSHSLKAIQWDYTDLFISFMEDRHASICG